MKCPGVHCPGCGGGGAACAGGVLASAAAAVWAFPRLAWILGTVAACGVLSVAAAAWLARRKTRSDQRSAVFTARPVPTAPREPSMALEGSQPRPAAIEPPRREYHLHLHGVSADELAAIIRNHEEDR